MNRTQTLAGLCAAIALAVAGCSQKEPAAEAIDAAEAALAAVHEDAQKYIPKQYAEVKEALDAARRDFTEEEYLRAIDQVKDVPARARELGEKAAAVREVLHAQITRDWDRLTAELPGRLASLDERLAGLDQARRLPSGLTRDALRRIGAAAAIARQAWDEATAAYEAGNLEGAVARALESEGLTAELTAELDAPPAATGS